MHDTVTWRSPGPSTSGQLSASRCNHWAFSPGPIIIICPVFIQYEAQWGRSTASATPSRIGCTSTLSRKAFDLMASLVKRLVLEPQNSCTPESDDLVPGRVSRMDSATRRAESAVFDAIRSFDLFFEVELRDDSRVQSGRRGLPRTLRMTGPRLVREESQLPQRLRTVLLPRGQRRLEVRVPQVDG